MPSPPAQRNTNTNTNTKYICDTGQTRNKLLAQWVRTAHACAGACGAAREARACTRASPLAPRTRVPLLRVLVVRGLLLQVPLAVEVPLVAYNGRSSGPPARVRSHVVEGADTRPSSTLSLATAPHGTRTRPQQTSPRAQMSGCRETNPPCSMLRHGSHKTHRASFVRSCSTCPVVRPSLRGG